MARQALVSATFQRKVSRESLLNVQVYYFHTLLSAVALLLAETF